MALSITAARSGDDPARHHAVPASLRDRSAIALHSVPACDATGLLAGAMNMLSDGIILTDGFARVLHANRSARMAVSRGLISIRGGWLHAAVPQETRTLQALIAACGKGRGRSAHVRVGARLCLTITRVEATADRHHAEGAVMVLLRDLDARTDPPPQSAIAYFGLTRAEARVAGEIISGAGLTCCAQRLGIRVTTARSHLRHVFEKTATKRQADLVRLLLSCGAGSVAPASWPGLEPSEGPDGAASRPDGGLTG